MLGLVLLLIILRLLLLLLLLIILLILVLLLVVILLVLTLVLVLLIAQELLRQGQVVACLIIRGIQTQRLLVSLHRLAIVFAIHEDVAHIVIDTRESLFALRGLHQLLTLSGQQLVLLSRLREFTLFIERITQVVGTLHRTGIHLQALAILNLRLRELLALIEFITRFHMLTFRLLGNRCLAHHKQQQHGEELHLSEHTVLPIQRQEIGQEQEKGDPSKDLELLVILGIDLAV